MKQPPLPLQRLYCTSQPRGDANPWTRFPEVREEPRGRRALQAVTARAAAPVGRARRPNPPREARKVWLVSLGPGRGVAPLLPRDDALEPLFFGAPVPLPGPGRAWRRGLAGRVLRGASPRPQGEAGGRAGGVQGAAAGCKAVSIMAGRGWGPQGHKATPAKTAPF